MNENPKPRANKRLEDRLAAAKAGTSCRIVVPGKCKVCKRRSPDVPATKTQVMAWFGGKDCTSFLKYQQRMLTEGLHRECQQVLDAKQKEKAAKRIERAARQRPVVLEPGKVERAIARRAAQNA